MTPSDLQKYVSAQLSAGINPDVLRMALQSEGVSTGEIEAAIAAASSHPINLSQALSQPASTANVMPQQTMPPMQEKVPSHFSLGKLLNKKVLVGILVLVLLGAGAAYGQTLMVTPEKVAKKVTENFSDIKSYDFDGTMDVNFSYSSGQKPVEGEKGSLTISDDVKAKVEFSGTSDIRNPVDPRSSFAVKITAEGMNFGFEMRTVDKIAYFKLNEFPALGFFGAGQIKDKWIRVDQEALAKELPYSSSLPTAETRLTPEQLQKIMSLYSQYPFINLGEKLSSEKMDNTSTYHYGFTVNQENLKKYVIEVFNAIFSAQASAGEDFAGTFVSGSFVSSTLDELFKVFKVSDGQVWVGKKDYFPRRISAKLNVVSPELTRDKFSGSVNVLLNFKNYNKPTQIEAPYPFIDVQDLINEYMPDTMTYPVDDSGLRGIGPETMIFE